MKNEFQSQGAFQDRWICYKHDLKPTLRRLVRRLLGRRDSASRIQSRFSSRLAKNLVLEMRLAVADGRPSWFYTAFDRGSSDPLTNYLLHHIEQNTPRASRICVTGCGTGITAFHLADCGFREVIGLDLLPECIAVANRIKQEYDYQQTSFYQGDCFRPNLPGTFDLITAMHWVFSAWMGNYGNTPVEAQLARDPEFREKLLKELFAVYVTKLNVGGELIIELTDAVADYRLAGEKSQSIYPVRHTPEQVRQCAAACGLDVVDYKLCVSYGHQPRVGYVLRRR